MIDQARLFQGTPESPAVAVDANGNAIVPSGESSSDDSFGAQVLLKDQAKVRSFSLSAGANGYYTSNVALTRRGARGDTFVIADASGSWSRALKPELELLIGLQASTFRYQDTSQLNFNSLGGGGGLSWTPRRWPGVNLFGRYDFTELLNRDGNEVLRDHQFSVGAQKVFALGRAHAFTVGLVGSVGISAPFAAQRDQVGPFVAYQLRLTRSFETSVSYRLGYQIYTSGNRQDLNQVFSWSLRYHFNDWADAAASFSLGGNRSNVSVFDYDVISSGVGLSFSTRF
ncbi:MAG: hypothetical protein ACR2MW_01155 [Chthoniobacterales bacterium]